MTIVLHRSPDPAPLVPTVPVSTPVDAPEPPLHRYFLMIDDGGADLTFLAEFATLSPGPGSRRRNGAGSKSFSYTPVSDVEPAAAHLIDDGELVTLRDKRLWLRHLRKGAVVWEGIVARQSVDATTGRVDVEAVTPEWLLEPLILGMEDRVDLFPQGTFDSSLTGWTSNGATGKALGTADPYRNPNYMILAGAPGAYEEATVTLPKAGGRNVVRCLCVAERLTAGGWPRRHVAVIIHQTLTDPPASAITDRGIYALAIDADAPVGEPVRVEVDLPELAGVRNRYKVRLQAPVDTGRVYEVSMARNENVSARAGWDFGVFMADVFDEIVRYMPAGWSRFVQEVGQRLFVSMKEPKANHPPLSSLVRDGERYGDWWVRLGTRRWRYGQRGVVRDDVVLSESAASALRLSVDATTAATKVAALAAGQDGPLREEGFAEDTSAGYTLHRAIDMPDGSDVRWLEVAAQAELDEHGPAQVMLEAAPVSLLPGDYAHVLEPGDRVPFRVRVGDIDQSGTARVESVALDDLSDLLSVEWSVV